VARTRTLVGSAQATDDGRVFPQHRVLSRFFEVRMIYPMTLFNSPRVTGEGVVSGGVECYAYGGQIVHSSSHGVLVKASNVNYLKTPTQVRSISKRRPDIFHGDVLDSR